VTLEVKARAALPIPLDVDFRVEPGELLALVGPSGSGKSTILRTIAGLHRPENAWVTVRRTTWLDTEIGLDIPPHRRPVGIVFQSYALFPHMTAVENVAAAIHDVPKGLRMEEARRLLDLVNLGDLGDRKPGQLSGGEKQRVAVARALARHPHVLLLDEPFSAVDRATRERLYSEIAALRKYLEMPAILVTHDMNEAQLLADRMLVIETGRTVADGSTAAVMSDPGALKVMGIREAASLLTARIAGQEPDGMTRLQTAVGPIWLPQSAGIEGAEVRIRILAHEVLLARERPEGLSAQNILPAIVLNLCPGEGPTVMVRLAVGEDHIMAQITQRAAEALALAPGDHAHAILKVMSIARDSVAVDQGATVTRT